MGDHIVLFFKYMTGHGMAHYSAQSWFVQSAFLRNLRICCFFGKRLGNPKMADSLKAYKIDVLFCSIGQNCFCAT